MIRHLHSAAYYLLPVVIPTPKHLLPTRGQQIRAKIATAKEELFQLYMQRCKLRADEHRLTVLINELELLAEYPTVSELATSLTRSALK